MTASRYFSLSPGTLGTSGFAYGVGASPDGPTVDVALVPSGRWADIGANRVALPAQQVARREVSEAEALSGLGTYVGRCVCVPRRTDQGQRWRYGVVTGHRWATPPERRILYVTGQAGMFDVVYEEDLLQDLAIETYAMRLCEGKSVLSVMAAEMRATNHAAYELFNSRGRTAVRDVAKICRRIGVDPVDEGGRVPLFEMVDMEVVQISARYILDFVYYHDGGRRPPAPIAFGATVFDEPDNGQAVASVAREEESLRQPIRSGLLDESSSDSDESLLGLARAGPIQAAARRGKRTREGSNDTDEGAARRTAERRRESSAAPGGQTLASGLDNSDTPLMLSDGRGQFSPTRLQTAVHQSIVSGTYLRMGPQLFLEQLQAQTGLLAFLPHPAVLKGFFGWEFGVRGLSIMHFHRMDMAARRSLLGELDMCDFSHRNGLPKAMRAGNLDDLIDALDCLGVLVTEVCQPFVVKLVEAARHFFLRQKALSAEFDEEDMWELVGWTDGRFEVLRAQIASGEDATHARIYEHFNAAHDTYLRSQASSSSVAWLEFLSYGRRFDTLLTPLTTDETAENGRVPDKVLRALPSQGDKKLCMKFLANQTCRGYGAECTFPYRAHFKPQRLPAVVRSYIDENLGGLKPDFKDL